MYSMVYILCISHTQISYLTFARNHIYSKQVENIILKVSNKDRLNTKLNILNEEIIYREYIICLKKHQLAIK